MVQQQSFFAFKDPSCSSNPVDPSGHLSSMQGGEIVSLGQMDGRVWRLAILLWAAFGPKTISGAGAFLGSSPSSLVVFLQDVHQCTAVSTPYPFVRQR